MNKKSFKELANAELKVRLIRVIRGFNYLLNLCNLWLNKRLDNEEVAEPNTY